jgi:hypothetical protein
MSPRRHHISDQTVGNILRRYDIAPAPQRVKRRHVLRRHMDVLAGTDFFTVEVLTWRGLVAYYLCPSCIWRHGA